LLGRLKTSRVRGLLNGTKTDSNPKKTLCQSGSLKLTKRKIKPITPSEVVVQKEKSFPEEVIQVFNDLIANNWNGRESCFTLKVARSAVVKALKLKKIKFEDCYLDIEEIYRKQGWNVIYDKPAIDESYDSFFKFTKPN